MPIAAILLVLMAIAAFVLWYAKREGIRIRLPGVSKRLKVVERLTLSQRTSLVLIEFDGRTLLLGVAGDRISVVEASSPKPASD
jgi:flagellar biogenesis protein FliO